MYCEKKDDIKRRSAQTVMYITVSSLLRLLAPILSFTSEEAWACLAHRSGDNTESVFLQPPAGL